MSDMYGFGVAEAVDEMVQDEAYEDSVDEGILDEAKRPMKRPVATASSASPYRPRPPVGMVTQAQLQTILARVTQQINTNSQAIRVVDGRVRTSAADHARLAAAMRKESGERKKDIEGVRKDLQSTREMSALIPLLTTLGGGNSSLAAFAPLLLLGSDMGGSNGANGGNGITGLLGGGLMPMVALFALTGGLGSK